MELLSPFVPDDYLDQCWPRRQTGGRHYGFSAAQLWRVHLLALITPVHSLNLLVRLLPEQKAWRRFAHLPNQAHVPDVRMLNTFREQVGVRGLRQINAQLLKELWTLKWHRYFNAAGRWTLAGGVQANAWPEWMRPMRAY